MKRILKLFAVIFALLLMTAPAVKAVNPIYVIDEYGVITESEKNELTELAERVSEAHNAGVYIRVMNDMDSYSTIEEYAESLWINEFMGMENADDGILLVLDMDTRSFDFFVRNGGLAEQAFGTYAREKMADSVVNGYLKKGDYYGAFRNYIAIADQYLAYAEAGTPISYDFDPERDEQEAAEQAQREQTQRTAKTGATVAIPPIVSLLACLGMKSKNKTTGLKKEASDYIVKNGVKLSKHRDHFLYRTESRTKINHDSNRGGGGSGFSSSSSSFGSHTSGHF